MDTSETYIKMCEKTEEIQGLWRPSMGDCIMVKERVEWDGYNLCADANEVTIVLGIDERNYSGNPIVGDVDDIAFYPECSWKGFDDTPKENLIWLPRQDQLQEMLAFENVPINSVAGVGYLLCLLQYPIGLKCTSMEQLWLAFVMKEKYNKIWNGEDWILDKPK